MPNIEWTGGHRVDIPGVDDEHRALFGSCGHLQRGLQQNLAPEEIESRLGELATRADDHFSHEEFQMRITRYPHYAWHRRQHRAARAKMQQLGQRLREGDRHAGLDLIESIARWLNDHVRLADRMWGAYLRNQQRARAARSS